jgi:glutamate-ammonia-ligase adenylyltransferase
MPHGFRLPLSWPPPADPAAAGRLLERFAALGRGPARLAAHPAGAALLRTLGGNAPYLADLALGQPAVLRLLAARGPAAAVASAMTRLGAVPPAAPRPRVAAALRQAKRAVALAVAVADIGGLWTLDEVTGALSALAEATLRRAVAHLLRGAHDAGELRLPRPDEPETGSGFCVLGMGKLGGRELNYSSDIDLVLLHDPDSGVYGGADAGTFFTRLARDLVALMEAHDANGYVFRVDLRLRPDPAATPPSVALQAAIMYYESMGQNWERAAMLKARPIAGDLALGAQFLDAIRPFIWRRHLDFAAVADIHAMKRRIDRTSNRSGSLLRGADPVACVAGHNVKLGQGGIREIEFLTQTLQLVWGGRDPALRSPRTEEALRLLAAAGHLPPRSADELAAAYGFLRRVEHRLQMVADRQTHTLPAEPEAMHRFALFMGYSDAASFATILMRHLDRVRRSYAGVFEVVPGLVESTAGPALDFRGSGSVPADTIAALEGMGYNNPQAIAAAVRGWQAGRVRALRSLLARELMEQMLPALLRALARHGPPDAAFARFDAFLARLPAGVQLLSLFQRNPALIERVAMVLGAAPSLSDHLARTPSALEGLLEPEEEPDFAAVLATRLADAHTLEETIGGICRTVREDDFSISVATLEGRLDADAAGLQRSALAEAAVAVLLERVLDDFAERFGHVPGGEMAVVALGKAGGREMMAGSDLDLMLIYDHPPDALESVGRRSIPASQWFLRAVHAFIAALTAPDAAGPLYAVDMRLRPSGNKGPVAVSFAAFTRYHAESAWTWERMALTRARVVAGPAAFRARVTAAIRAAIMAAGEPERIRADAAAMRARMQRDLPARGPWDVKLLPGGQIEVEFVAQTLQLVHARAHPEVLDQTSRVALARLGAAGLLAEADAGLLIHADHVWRTVQGMLRLTETRPPGATLSEASAAALARAAASAGLAALDAAGLSATLAALAQRVRAAFVRHVGEMKP